MALQAGTRFGPYEIIAPLGQGGMGEVYRARDTKLDRTVAVKVLPPALAGDPDFRARFDREARIISQLSHPNICTLHDVGRDAAADYLVLEYIEGETLAERLARGPLPLEETLSIATQIGQALAAAHRAGIVHRDLKPGNVMLAGRWAPGRQGIVKLLDFGLACSLHVTQAPGGTVLDTATAPLTVKGTLVGTMPYMAPELFDGAAADDRSDLWALGCILYEMLTGRRAFAATGDASLIAAILEREPEPLRSHAPDVVPAIERIVRACLAKHPDERLQSAQDLLLALQWSRDDPGPVVASTRGRRWRALAPSLGIGVFALALGAAAATLLLPGWRSPAADVIRAAIPLPPGGALGPFGSNVAMSPDGRTVAFVSRDAGVSRLYVRPVDRFEARMIRGTDGAESPFFSPDGTQVAFSAGGKLRRVGIDDGIVRDIWEAAGARGAAWAPDGTIVYAPSYNDGLWRVRVDGAAPPERFTTLDVSQHERTHRFPAMLPDGRTVLFMAGDMDMTSYAEASIFAQSLDGGPPRLLVRGGLSPRYVAGHLIYNAAGSLMAVPFDVSRLALSGQARTIAEDVAWSTIFGTTHYDVGGDGQLVFIPGEETVPRSTVIWLDHAEHRMPVAEQLRSFFGGVRVSPDGSRLLLLDQAANDVLRAFDIGRGTLTRLTFRGNTAFGAWIPPHGQQVAYIMGTSIARIEGAGMGNAEMLYEHGTQKMSIDVAPDGRQIVFDSEEPGTGADIMLLEMDSRTVRPWLATRFTETQPRFSPDGHWIAYVSDESGRFEVFVRSTGQDARMFQVSTLGGSSPVWHRSGAQLFFVKDTEGASGRAGGDLYAADISAAGAGRPRLVANDVWRTPPIVSPFGVPIFGYDIMPDGRFVLIETQPPVEPTRINLFWGTLPR